MYQSPQLQPVHYYLYHLTTQLQPMFYISTLHLVTIAKTIMHQHQSITTST